MIDKRFYSRKFLLSMLVQVSAIVGLTTGALESADFTQISTAVIAAYSLSNAAVSFANREG
jgi:hypothetical protein